MNMKKERINKMSKICAVFTFLILVASIIFQVSITNKYAIKGSEMVELSGREASLKREISILQLQASELGSMSKIESQAQNLGFVEYDKTIAVIASSQFTAAR